jgi:aldose 1-epimerase
MDLAPSPRPASGQQFEISAGTSTATVVEVGAGLRSYAVDGRELLDGHAADEMATSARGQPLIPWPNRLHDGRYSWDGAEQRMPLNEPDKGNAIHGFARFRNWTCIVHTTERVDMGITLYPRPGYPFTLVMTLSYRISPDGLTVVTTARNAGRNPLPYASGQHPYLSLGGDLIDNGTLEAPGATYLPTDDNGIPTGTDPVDGTPYDFRDPRPLGTTQIDYAFGDLVRDSAGKAWVRLRNSNGVGAAIWVDEGYPYVELFTGDTLAADRRRRGLGVEPMTAPPNGLQTGTDIHRIEPDDSVVTRWGVEPLGRPSA